MHKVSIIKRIMQWGFDRGFDKIEYSHSGCITNQLEEMFERTRKITNESARSFSKSIVSTWFVEDNRIKEHEIIDSMADQIVFLINDMSKLGYDAEKVLAECYKEINSRTGDWSEAEQKWVKDKSKKARAKWCEADYSGCKL